MPYYITCPHCGSNLDPGEKCDCQSQKEKQVTIKRKPQRRAAATIRPRADAEKTMVLATNARRA